MIAVDTSAIMAILLNEPQAESCKAVLEAERVVVISAATLTETLIVAQLRNLRAEAADFVDRLGSEVETVTPASAQRVADAYARWGKGVHPARLNFGDCFAYEIAKERDCPLLFVGNDFSRTDIRSALPTSSA